MLYFSIQNCRQDRTGKVSEAAGARWRFYPRLSSDYPRLSSDYPRLSSIRLYIGGSTWGTFTWDLPLQDYVAGAVFGEGGVWLYVAGAALRDILGDSRSAKCLYFSIQNCRQDRTGKVSEAAGARWQFYRRISSDMFGLSSNRLSIGGSNSGILRWNHELRISWQAQYLVRLEGGFACCAHWKWRFMCDAEHWCDSFCVAGTVFGEAGVWLFVAGAVFGEGGPWRSD